MIYDNISNIRNYVEISEKVIDFIENLTPETPVGHYEIESLTYANIDCYTTKLPKDGKLESHKKYIDIQILLEGEERLDYTDITGLEVNIPYSEEKDVMFYANPKTFLNSVKLENGKFILLYPHEAHQPQMALDSQMAVKKVVVKIPV